MSASFDIDIVRREDVAFVLVRGDIDLATGPELDAALARAEASDAGTIVVDLEHVTFMDARGLGVLVNHASDQEHGRRLQITPGPPQVRRLFELSSLRTQLPFRSLS